jgi:hypothetical protein
VASLDGSEPLGDAAAHAAESSELSDDESRELGEDVLRIARELLELGALEFA